jgi:uncharacterized protein YndB with AHSA1/START domain
MTRRDRARVGRFCSLDAIGARVFDAPREVAYRAFTDPDHLATWWGLSGNTLPQDEIEFDVRPGGFQGWTGVSAAQADLRVHIHIDLTDVADGDLLEGVATDAEA